MASVSTALAAMKVPCTISGAIALGKMWRNKITGVGVARALAASTKGSSRKVSTSERTRRVTRGISGMAIATTTVHSCAPSAATRAMASRMAGMAIRPSMKRISTMSSARKYPANMPKAPPTSSATTAVNRPTSKDTRVP